MQALVLLSFIIAFSIFNTAKAQGDFLPLIADESYHTHVYANFNKSIEKHNVFYNIDGHTLSSLCKGGDKLACGQASYLDAVETLRKYKGVKLLRKVDSYFNKIPYALDKDVYGKDDYWASPAEFLSKGAGDCEDFVLAKYFALQDLGWDENKMHIVLLWDEKEKIHHAVLLVRHEEQEWLLDNGNRRLMTATGADHYTPLYAVNQNESLYFHRHYAQANN